MKIPVLRLKDILLTSIQVDLTDEDALEFQDDILMSRLSEIAKNAGYQIVDHNLVLHVKKIDS